MRAIFVAGAWGSGTSMVMGALDCLGVATFGPHFLSNDPRTPNTFELDAFRKVFLDHVDETSMLPRGEFREPEDFSRRMTSALELLGDRIERGEFGSWRQGAPEIVALKMPLASMYLPLIARALEVDIILIHRPLEEIEASRLRRRWPAHFGAKGAKRLYSQVFTDLIAHRLSALMLSHRDLTSDARGSLKKVIDYCGLQSLEGNLDSAVNFIRTD